MLSTTELELLHTSLLDNFAYDYSNSNHLLAIDLVTVFGSIYVKDILTSKRSSMVLIIPVFNLELWNTLSNDVNKLVSWVSRENFNISFVLNNFPIDKFEGSNKLHLPSNRAVTLFSGGLDSLTGAFQNYRDQIDSDYLGFLNKDEEKTKQVKLSKFYKRTFPNTEVTLIPKPGPAKIYRTQATRSLMYFSLAVSNCLFNHSTNVFLYENGILSLNPNLNSRFTTKTTHPKTMYIFKSIIKKIGLDIDIHHPFLFSTKGENIEAMNEDFKNQIADSFTCGASRSNYKPHEGQCGVCIPCLLRKISMAAYDNEGYDSQYHISYESKLSKIKNNYFRKEYDSHLNYFSQYCALIKDKAIYQELKTRSLYYDNKDYFAKQEIMFEKFTFEFERFMKKYDPY